MCTVTLLHHREPGGASWLLGAMNRDERVTRPASSPLTIHERMGRRAAWSLDPPGGGTWLALTQDGLLLALLNQYPLPGEIPPPGRSSRGRLVTELAHMPASQVSGRLASIAPGDYAPFRLVTARIASDGQPEVGDHQFDGQRLVTAAPSLPFHASSSSWNTCEVLSWRASHHTAWLQSAMDGSPSRTEVMRALLQLHLAPAAREGRAFDIPMSRPDARTHSVSVFELSSHGTATLRQLDLHDAPPTPTQALDAFPEAPWACAFAASHRPAELPPI